MLLTNKQRRLVKENILNTAQLAKALGVSWPTADKIRRDLCPFYSRLREKEAA
jgi:Mn-dependent DtxR family transcriptional regulator